MSPKARTTIKRKRDKNKNEMERWKEME